MPARLVAVAALTVAALAAAPAYGKGLDVTATIVTPIPANAQPGTPVRVVWSLRIEEASHPVNADGVYLRVVGADGSRQDAYARPGAHEDGDLRRDRPGPVGGVESAVVGIRGTASYAAAAPRAATRFPTRERARRDGSSGGLGDAAHRDRPRHARRGRAGPRLEPPRVGRSRGDGGVDSSSCSARS